MANKFTMKRALVLMLGLMMIIVVFISVIATRDDAFRGLPKATWSESEVEPGAPLSGESFAHAEPPTHDAPDPQVEPLRLGPAADTSLIADVTHSTATEAKRIDRPIPITPPVPAQSVGTRPSPGSGKGKRGDPSEMGSAGAKILSKRYNMQDPNVRRRVAEELTRAHEAELQYAYAMAAQRGLPVVREDGSILIGFSGGQPVYEADDNVKAAISTAADKVRETSPFNVDGAGVLIGLWEAGDVPRLTHQEFQGRITTGDSETSTDNHATHVAGTLIAAGINPDVKGMAVLAEIKAYNSSYDEIEMLLLGAATTNESAKVYISNHSYSTTHGWNGTDWRGTFVNDGNPSNDYEELFGQYSASAAEWDGIAWNLPYYLIFKSAGNDRNDDAPSAGQQWTHNGSGNYTYDPAQHPAADYAYRVDGAVAGFGTMGQKASAKNVLSVGAISDAVSGGERDLGVASLYSGSNFGPTDDGRIKPDLVANGISLESCFSSSDTATGFMSGTSMSTPNACGTAALLQDYYDDRFTNQQMRSSMLKGLLIHTADDMGNPGPDYRYGWGLLNAAAAAGLVKDHADNYPHELRLLDDRLTTAEPTRSYDLQYDGSNKIVVTVCWTDPPGTFTFSHDSRTRRLVNDLNIRVTSPHGGGVFFPFAMPWVDDWTDTRLNDDAITGTNHVDNVEQVYIATPPAPGVYQISVDYAGSLQDDLQSFSLLVSGGRILVDDDGDGMPNSWELMYGLNITTHDAALDHDGDGMSNYREYVAGSNPTNALSLLRIETVTLTSVTNLVVEWQSETDKRYSIQRDTDDLAEASWTVLQSNMLASPPVNQHTVDVDSAEAVFYRIEVEH